jgi:dTDP-4-amino-4,6-dideoxygalactose transaminase
MLLPTNVKAQAQPPDRESSHQFFVVETGGDRDQIRSALKVKGIQTKVHYRLPYMMPAYQGSDFLKGTESIPVTEEVAKRIMTLPFHNRFTRREAECVCKVLGEVHK